jgi:hypothetical protein
MKWILNNNTIYKIRKNLNKLYTFTIINCIQKFTLESRKNYTSRFNSNISKDKLKYKTPSETYTESDITYGRNFGVWKCLKCGNIWSSAYTWISLNFCLNNNKILKIKNKKDKIIDEWFSGAKLKDNDFILEECQHCCNKDNSVKIIRYKNLKCAQATSGGDIDNRIPHREDLCIKCLKGYKCRRHSDTIL